MCVYSPVEENRCGCTIMIIPAPYTFLQPIKTAIALIYILGDTCTPGFNEPEREQVHVMTSALSMHATESIYNSRVCIITHIFCIMQLLWSMGLLYCQNHTRSYNPNFGRGMDKEGAVDRTAGGEVVGLGQKEERWWD